MRPRTWFALAVVALAAAASSPRGVSADEARAEGASSTSPVAVSPDTPAIRELLPFGAERLVGWPVKQGPFRTWRASIDEGLRWLQAHQADHGGWEAKTFGSWCDGKRQKAESRGPGRTVYDVGVTGLSVMAFLGAGYDHVTPSPYRATVMRGLWYLITAQDGEGCIGPRSSQRYIYNHAWGAAALVEAYGMTGHEALRRPAQKALDFVRLCRNPYFAFRYGVKPGDNDTSVTSALAMSLWAAGRVNETLANAGLERAFRVDQEAWDGIRAWLDKMTDPDYGRTGYLQRGGAPARYTDLHGEDDDKWPRDVGEAMTAAGMVLRLRMGENPKRSVILKRGAELISKTPPLWEGWKVDLVYWHEATLALHGMGGRWWSRWVEPLEKALVETQHLSDGVRDRQGSWNPRGAWGMEGGRVYATALSVLTLEVPIRYGARKNLSKVLSSAVRAQSLDIDRRRRALHALARTDPKNFLSLVARVLSYEAGPERVLVVDALERLPLEPAPKRLLVEKIAGVAASHPAAAVRVAALGVLGRIGERAAPHVGAIRLLLDDETPEVSEAALASLVSLAAAVPAATGAFAADLGHPDPLRRARAAAVVLAGDPEHARARQVLREALTTQSAAERAVACRGLGLAAPSWFEATREQLLAAADARLPVAFENDLGMRFLLMPSGTFTMGSPADERDRLKDETLHEVTLTKPYYLQVTEVTNGHVRRWKKTHDSGTCEDGTFNEDDQPALMVAHGDAKSFADWLGEQDPGHVYRLPTEAEWEHAARAGTTTRFWWGDEEDGAGQRENVADQAAKLHYPKGFGQWVESTPGWRFFRSQDDILFTGAVGTLQPNPWGLHDVLGNAAEWVGDWRGPYVKDSQTDPRGPPSGATRVFRGGSWVASPQQARAAMRGYLPTPLQPGHATRWIGFRLAAEPKK